MHIHITFMTYHLYMLIACQSLSLHVLCLWHNFYLYFYCIPVSILYIFFASFLYFHVHFLSCSYTVHISYTFISRILSYNLSYTILYFYLHSYNFHIRYSCILLYVFHLFLVFFIFEFYNLSHSMYYYIYHLLSCTYIIFPFM